MKVILLAGGFGTRISEESHLKPKPMIEIGGKPILWHIMKIYSYYGFNDFVICLGYKSHVIKEFFYDYYLHTSDITIDLINNKVTYLHNSAEPWKITLIDTGLQTMTGGRIKRIQPYVENETFLLSYGDGVSDVNIPAIIDAHQQSEKLLTVTAVQPQGRFGSLDIINNNDVQGFLEKPKGDEGWINAGFFVCEPEIFQYIDGDDTIFEQEPMQRLAKENQFGAYKHTGFWQPMDTIRDRTFLEKLWENDEAPWKRWKD